MLMYTGSAARSYGRHPFKPATRKGWEFQAVLEGEIGVLWPEGPEPLHARTLWVSPPGHNHGWTGNPEQDAEVAVFHFLSVPPVVARYCFGARAKMLRIGLTQPQCRRLRELASEAIRYRQRFNIGSLLSSHHMLLELSLMVYEACDRERLPSAEAYAQDCVEKALEWYSDHLVENPDQESVARTSGVSVSHLRRIFHKIMGASPRQVLDQVRFGRATELMSDPGSKLSDVAERCGFQSASAFSRAFKNSFGCSPAEWRGH
jgi:AraC family transcriptional regulator